MAEIRQAARHCRPPPYGPIYQQPMPGNTLQASLSANSVSRLARRRASRSLLESFAEGHKSLVVWEMMLF